MLRLYNIFLLPLKAVSAILGRRFASDPVRSREWAERRAKVVPRGRPGAVWIHGSSVGEVRLVRLLVDAIGEKRPDLPFVASAYTPSGRARLPEPPDVDAAFFLPLDFRGYPSRILRALHPSALVLVETELWPNLVGEAAASGVPVALVNGRLSRRRMSRYRRLRRLYGPMLSSLTVVGAQSDADADRFRELGVAERSVVVTGNVKYDIPPSTASPERLLKRFGLDADRPILVAGSTGPGEESQVVDAFVRARAQSPEPFLILAPRHPERAAEVEREASSRGLRLHRLSGGDDRRAGKSDGLLVDSVGELADLYAIARVAFVGGSLIPVGGHNVLEPAAAAVPVLFGPHTDNFSEPADALLASGGALRVRDSAELARVWVELVRDPLRRDRMASHAAGVVRANRGALERSVDLILSVADAEGSNPGGSSC